MHPLDSVLKTPLNISTGQAQNRLNDRENQRLRKACHDFEALFLGYMFETMRKTVPSTSDHGLGKDSFTSLFDAQLAKRAAEQKLGLGEMLYKELSGTLSLSEVDSAPSEERQKG